ncbi:unnamed protein product [Choristocarpus tenellus]
MGFTLWNLFKAGLLVCNAVAILHRERFLRKLNLAEVDRSTSASSLRNQVVGLISAVGYLRGPLIVVNSLTCLFELILG